METKMLLTSCCFIYLTSLAASQMQFRPNQWFNPNRQLNARHVPRLPDTMNYLPSRGRHHHDRDRRVRRMGVKLSGPYVCHEKGSSFCCPGWAIDNNGKTCTKPICEEGSCGNTGICRRPNLCLCSNGRTMRECAPEQSEEFRCNIRCMHGGECVDNQCRCTYGFTGPHCGQPICGSGCLNGGRCIAPGRCACVYGFTGMRCERDYRKGPCFMNRTNTTCTNEVMGMMSTKLFCCATVGEGWGHPCEECPARVGNCTKGRLPPQCTDINECDVMPGLCEGGMCVNTEGSFVCDCPKGFRHDRNLHQCIDINECETPHMCAGGECTNTEGGYECHCPPESKLSLDRSYCISDVPGRCFTVIESGMCASPLENLVRRTTCCCVQSGQETLGKCFAAVGQTPERCATIGTPEYEQDCGGVEATSSLCDILGATACSNGRCIEQPELRDYYCECDDGYMPSDDSKECVDVNECIANLGQDRKICGRYGTCLNTDGSYRCHCSNGFENEPGSLTRCIDINECQRSNAQDLCDNGACINTRGSFICNCNDGYRAAATQQSCDDVNECSETEGLCEHGRCVNLVGDYRCICNPGFTASPDSKECLDNNECEKDNMCANGVCVNMEGMFKCQCHTGFALVANGESCADINECATNPCANGRCENTIGSFRCICHQFQALDETGMRCILNDNTAQCYRSVRNGQCRPGNALSMSATRGDCCCAVPGATSAWGASCEPCPEVGDADYAVLCHAHVVSNICDLLENACENGHCLKMGNNRYRCVCNSGFLVSEDMRSCTDYDECTQSLCSNGVCRNTPGSYSCTCNDGFLLNGDVCEDIDECLSNPCTNARCVNEPGRYRCVCEEGRQLDVSGHVCHDVRVGRCWLHYSGGECMGSAGSKLLTVEECCNSVGEAWGSVDCTPCEAFELKCNSGYSFDLQSNSCINIRECNFGVCESRAECIDTEGSFKCICPPGFTLNKDGLTCSDLRVGTCFLELDSDGGCSGSGISVGSSVISKADCCCSAGMAWSNNCAVCPQKGTQSWNELCPEGLHARNECILFPDMCTNGLCKNTDSSFTCECNRGFTLDEYGRNCTDINECQISPGLCGNGVCVNVNGDFKCNCSEGYEASASMKVCMDIDECARGGVCTGGSCINTDGSYQCMCPDGRSVSEDGTSCVDIDECALQPHLCSPNGRCENMLGYFMCVCDAGYKPTADAQNCVDVDECANNNGGCHMGCTNTLGSYECICEEGFVLSFDKHTCADRDECMEQMNRCDGGRCENIVGAFRCICFDGFMSTSDLQFCEDIDECAMNPHVCMNGKCHNTRGSYTCSCEPGYCVPRNQMICVDEDECELSKHMCHVNADCNNTDGGYECSCIQGFNGDGFMCHDDDECESGTHMCHEFADCRNKLGGYECDCRDGFHGDGFSCSDNDDCLEDDTLCGPYGECLNVDGSFECDCPMGFITTADRKACKDIDECSFEEVCVNGRCHNVPGAFKCACLDGYEKDERGANCTDVDECLNVANCINGRCFNTEGSYQCECPEAFEMNPTGVGCVDNRVGDCFLHSTGGQNALICSDAIGVGVNKATCCCLEGAGWGNPCEVCPQPNTTEYDTLCPGGVGFKPNPITVLLEDIDECRNLPGLCQGGQCINVFGSYVCDCNLGYQFNEESKTCKDVNECEVEDNNICGAGTCRNTVGGFNCVCPEGYRSILGGRKCEDIRLKSCYRYYNETAEECSNDMFTETKKVCCCYENVGQGWNSPCERCPEPGSDEFSDLCGAASYTASADVCTTISKLCDNGLCVPLEDGYKCECSMGYHFNEQLLICEDDDECVNEDMCFADAECVNQPGSYTCSCMKGFTFNAETETCDDIDECDLLGACANGACTNTRGGFICDCNQGFQSVNEDKACEDINECERNPCGHGVCNNVFGSFTCTCNNGYHISDNGDCVDTDECEEQGQCGQGTCENLPGGFACDCQNGYSVTPDGRNCIDTNECQEDPLVCGVGTCQNMDGSFKCYCPDGFSSEDQTSCNDVDECLTNDYCKFGTCENNPGSFRCLCPEGFDLSENKRHCIDTREAFCYFELSDGICAKAGYRDLTYGGCCCQCRNAGWGNAENNCTACPRVGTDEFNDLCPNGCGYTPQGIDIDECRENPCINGKCMNMAASFRCLCMSGYTLDESGIRCVDVNECETSPNSCGNGQCENTDGSFECECEPGFYNGPTITCVDIDECRDNSLNHCGFRCENTVGSFHCACPQGFKLRSDGRMCEDLDECSSDSLNDCTAKGMTCKNVVGYYTCLCPPGYRRIGTADACVDVNECDQVRVCTNGICINSDGSYRCECSQGYDYDEENKMCLDTRQGVCYAAVHQRMCELTSTTGLMFTKAECCCNRGKGWGETCEECPHPGTEAFLILCPHGMGFKPNGDDIDDCKVIPGLCAHGTCINTLGGYRCACDHGYKPTNLKRACADINECMASPAPCSFDCRNTEGSYECVCPAGYHTDQTGASCVDFDECTTKRHKCQYICANTVGSYKCECPHGFVQEDSKCVDKNECMDMPGICGARGICRNDPGGYHCECPRGYRRGMGEACIDVNECNGGQGDCAGSCQNVPGSFRCLCGRGYSSTLYGRGCQDVNECTRNPCGMGQSCTNNRGGFECGCSRGLTKMGGSCGDVDECQIGGGSCQYGCQNTYGGFSCSCPRGFFRLGSGHCIRGSGGFQQRIPHMPMYPGFGNQGRNMPPMGGGYGGMAQQPRMGMGQFARQDTVCYSCMPGGDVRRRQRRSADEPEGRFIEIHDRNGKATLNTTYPIEIFISRHNVSRRTPLLELRASLKQLRDHSRYQIVAGNKVRFFRIHHRDQISVLHFTKNAINADERVTIESAEYRLHLKVTTTLDQDAIRQTSFESETIQEAIEEAVDLEVKVFLED